MNLVILWVCHIRRCLVLLCFLGIKVSNLTSSFQMMIVMVFSNCMVSSIICTRGHWSWCLLKWVEVDFQKYVYSDILVSKSME